jgi:hypothetical protein
MPEETPHSQLIADLKNIGMPEAETIAVKSSVSATVKTEAGTLVFKNGILVKFEKAKD